MSLKSEQIQGRADSSGMTEIMDPPKQIPWLLEEPHKQLWQEGLSDSTFISSLSILTPVKEHFVLF